MCAVLVCFYPTRSRCFLVVLFWALLASLCGRWPSRLLSQHTHPSHQPCPPSEGPVRIPSARVIRTRRRRRRSPWSPAALQGCLPSSQLRSPGVNTVAFLFLCLVSCVFITRVAAASATWVNLFLVFSDAPSILPVPLVGSQSIQPGPLGTSCLFPPCPAGLPFVAT